MALTLALGAALSLGGAASAGTAATVWPFPALNFTLGGKVSPRNLPRRELAPVTAGLSGKITTSDGTHPSALRELIVDIDKDAMLDTTGLPACGWRQLAGRSTGAGNDACRGAIVGTGRADIEIDSTEPAAAISAARLTLFNGGTADGKTRLFIHAFISGPTPTVIVTTVTIQRKGSGLYAVATIPVIAGGTGSILDFSFVLGRRYVFKKEEGSYLEAKCPDGVFKVSVPRAAFENEAHTPGIPASTVLKGGITVPCTPKGQ